MTNLLTTRYAVLHHEGISEPHYDLLLDLQPPASLATWRSPAWPILQNTELLRLRDHRRAYLDYEGPISGGRGFARRVDSGPCQVHLRTSSEIELTLNAQTLTLRKLDDERWVAVVPSSA